jgi:hypothetical protein
MNKFLLLLTTLALAGTARLYSQNSTDSIEIRKVTGTVFLQNGRKLTPAQLVKITQFNAVANQEMKVAKSNYDVSMVFACAGGALIGWPLGTAMGGGKPNWALAGIGAGLVIIAIPISNSATNHAKKAVRTYNDGLKSTGMVQPVEFQFGFTNGGIGFKVLF